MFSRFSSKITVRPSDIDMNGHVHHSLYLDYLLAARTEQMKLCYKMPWEEFTGLGLAWMVRRYEIEYKRSLKMGEFALVTTWVQDIGSKENRKAASVAKIGFEIGISDSGKIAALGHAEYVLVDINSGRAVSIPDEVIRRYSV